MAKDIVDNRLHIGSCLIVARDDVQWEWNHFRVNFRIGYIYCKSCDRLLMSCFIFSGLFKLKIGITVYFI